MDTFIFSIITFSVIVIGPASICYLLKIAMRSKRLEKLFVSFFNSLMADNSDKITCFADCQDENE